MTLQESHKNIELEAIIYIYVKDLYGKKSKEEKYK